MTGARLLSGSTTHARRGAVKNSFTYGVDYVLIDPRETRGLWPLFTRNRVGIMALHDRDHGGQRGAGHGVTWAEEVFRTAGLDPAELRIWLLAQPRFMGFWFNPVAFWIAERDSALVAVIAEVNNTMGDRHSYLCKREGFAPIRPSDVIEAEKVFHVSPFQEVAGTYRFRFSLGDDRIAILIDHVNGTGGVTATLTGPVEPLTHGTLARAALRRPTGALRVMALILWQAAKLKLKGARFRRRPEPPMEEVT
ncbi:DUF1365 domain-containing protein [Maritimibacter sp. DP1N21-5]|uniref:DUF1365 domain-containing protein n=1 Tax=Maritimibacter sp. DP1N21-5 TaxID=2836867 RepID=UPI001C4585F3|nr:DUF1365 domain-containing protein [Maritimibacter sp. DP1N21-5]MBV7409359.1 DUF1365 domain-containing protein [Maritimibacter sp. DP1N21-5]